jgi:hypothetical protein
MGEKKTKQKTQKKQPCTVYGSGIKFKIFWKKKGT